METSLLMTEEARIAFIRNHFLKSALPLDRCSQILFSQLANMPSPDSLTYPFQFVEKEILSLENGTSSKTKKETTYYCNNRLKGFMHKHFYVPYYEHPAVNCQLYWKLKSVKSKKFEQMGLGVAEPFKGLPETEETLAKFNSELADEFIRGAKNRELTGDWLIYLPHEGQNYYLCIAKHNEDDFILEAVKCCLHEFPFIAEYIVE